VHYSDPKNINNQQIINFEVPVLLIYTFRKLKILQLFLCSFFVSYCFLSMRIKGREREVFKPINLCYVFYDM